MPAAKVRLDGYQLKTSFSEGLAVVAGDRKSRVIDVKGVPLLELGRSYVEDEAGRTGPDVPHRLGFVDAEGAVLPHQLLSAQFFSEGLALAEERSDRKGRRRRFVDRTGETVVEAPASIGQVLPFMAGLSRVGDGRRGDALRLHGQDGRSRHPCPLRERLTLFGRACRREGLARPRRARPGLRRPERHVRHSSPLLGPSCQA